MISGVIFDYDGVIVQTEQAWDEADKRFLASHGVIDFHLDYKPQIVGQSLTEGAKILMDVFGFDGDPERLGEERFEIAKEYLKETSKFTEGFLEFLNSVKDLPKCVATASHPELFKIVDEKLGISTLFDNKVFYISDVGNIGKPKPDIFLYAANRLGVNPTDCLVIEDSPNGLLAAHNAGMKCVALTTTFGREYLSEADTIVDGFGEIYLEALFASRS